MKIFIAADHGGFALKKHLSRVLEKRKYTVVDVGNSVYDKDDDYPDYIAKAALAVSKHPNSSMAIVIGGSGQGEAIVANRFPSVRAAVFYGGRPAVSAVDVSGRRSADPYEILRLSRQHNNANVLSIGARFVTNNQAEKAIMIWLKTVYLKQKRHERRIRKIEKVS
ncbi:RpiB/LacA/LacB family sugar-phosphate isomerase [Candidatus Uhrbacteria bacterium]|nr:RpiB/LacA/LacB family sugar-phosphate isomerase [Candidatus Uhrbacteria bacterium]